MKKSFNKNYDNDLIEAVKANDAESVKALLDKGADPNASDNDGSTALAWAVSLNFRRFGIAKILLEKGANPNQKDNGGWTAFLSALQGGDPEFIILLLNYGADLSDQSHKNEVLVVSTMELLMSNPDVKKIIDEHLTEVEAGKKTINYYWRDK